MATNFSLAGFLFAAEMLLVGILTWIASHSFSQTVAVEMTIPGQLAIPRMGDLSVALIVALTLGVYALFRTLRVPYGTFWVIAGLALLLQMPAILAHTRLDWLGILTNDKNFLSNISRGFILNLKIII